MKYKMMKFLPPLLLITVLMLFWELSVKVFSIPKWLLPAPINIVQEIISGWKNIMEHIFPTIQLSVIGLLVGVSLGIIVAIFLHLVSFARLAIYPLLIVTQNIPIIVLAPLLVIWFGFGVLPKIIVITLVCFFPITIATLDGFRQTNTDFLYYMKMAGATKYQIFRKLEWPHALPSLFSGLKIAATYSVMGAVISEWLGASKGLGVYMTLASSSFRTDRVFVAIFSVVILSLLFFLLISCLEKMVIKWKPREEGYNIGKT